jgi:hypothetical protein
VSLLPAPPEKTQGRIENEQQADDGRLDIFVEKQLQDDCRFEQAGDGCDELSDEHAPDRNFGVRGCIRPASLQAPRGFLTG